MEHKKCEFKGIDGNGNTINIFVKFVREGSMFIAPDYTMIDSTRYSKASDAIDFVENRNKFSIENQTYLGTIKSIASDAIQDLYFINYSNSHDVVTRDASDSAVTNTVTTRENFIMAIPSLAYLPDGDTGATPSSLKVDGIIFGTINDRYEDRTSGTVSINDGFDGKSVITDDVVMDSPDVLTIYPMCLDGINGLSMFNGIEILTNTGQINSDVTLPTQIIELGEVTELFKTYMTTKGTDFIPLPLSIIMPSGVGRYVYSGTKLTDVKAGKLAISIDF